MLTVHPIDNNHVFFYVIGHYCLLSNGQTAPMSQMKEIVSQNLRHIYGNADVNWEPIDKYLEDNKESYGQFEDWAKLASELERSNDTWQKYLFASTMIEQGKALSDLAQSDDDFIRTIVADAGYCLDTLMNDKNPYVRTAVAKQGYGLETLVKDIHTSVREAVAKQGYGFDKLYNDARVSVRLIVARQGYRPDLMKDDKSPRVRAMLAKKGCYLDIFADDPSSIVRRAVENYDRTQWSTKNN